MALGDSSAIDRQVTEHLPAALAFALRLTGDADQAEEIVQEALHRAWRSRSAFRGESQFKTWLFSIVVNVFRDQLAQQKITHPLPDDVGDPQQANPREIAMQEELGRIVARHVSELPPRQREVLVLCTYEGLTASQAAGVLSISEANVYSTLHVARLRLWKQLAPYFVES